MSVSPAHAMHPIRPSHSGYQRALSAGWVSSNCGIESLRHFTRTAMKALAIVIIFSAGTLLIGCASIARHTETPNEVGPYAGVRADAHLLANPNSVQKPPVHPAIVVTLCVIDLPLSMALDTLLLPIDLTYRKRDLTIELALLEFKLHAAVLSDAPDEPAKVPVRFKLRNPRPKAIKLRVASLERVIRFCDYLDADGQRWQFTRDDSKAIEDDQTVVPLEAETEAEFELVLFVGRELFRLAGQGRKVTAGGQPPASLRFNVRENTVLTDSDARIMIRGSGTVSIQR